jgi:hypothetical protein
VGSGIPSLGKLKKLAVSNGIATFNESFFDTWREYAATANHAQVIFYD